jgi:hypothetical protein
MHHSAPPSGRDSDRERETRTLQVNVRLSETLVADVDRISRVLGISRGEYIKQQLADAIMHAKMRLLGDLSSLRSAGILSEEDFSRYSQEFTRSLRSSGEDAAALTRPDADPVNDPGDTGKRGEAKRP